MHDRRGADSGMLAASHASDLLHCGQLSRAVVLPQPVEPPQLALQIAGRLAEPIEADLSPVDLVQLDQRVEQLVSDPLSVLGRVERLRNARRDDVALHLLHHVERCSDDLDVVTHREDSRCADGGWLERTQQPGLPQDIVGAWRQRPARRAPEHDPG